SSSSSHSQWTGVGFADFTFRVPGLRSSCWTAALGALESGVRDSSDTRGTAVSARPRGSADAEWRLNRGISTRGPGVPSDESGTKAAIPPNNVPAAKIQPADILLSDFMT